MKLKKMLAVVLAAASLLGATAMMSGCSSEEKDPKEASYTSQEDAITAVTKDTQEVAAQIEVRDNATVVVWSNLSDDASAPFTMGLLEKDGEDWKVTNTSNVTMEDKFSGKGSYPVKGPLITYAVTPSIDDPEAENYAEHKEINNWCFHWTIVPELPA